MTVKSTLCAYSGEANKRSGLHRAIQLARHHGAWLTGVMPHGRPYLETHFASQVSDSILKTLEQIDTAHIDEVRHRFETETAAAGLGDRAEFVALDTRHGDSVEAFARGFDLVVCGVHTDVTSTAHLAAHPDLIALRSGRPVVVVPDGFEAPALADHAVVAWDGKRSAARALGDAIPALEEKARVTVLTVGSDPVPGVERILQNLDRHGIAAELANRPRHRSVANTILEATAELGAELIVMGAFEHSKFTHDVIGGVTTDVIRDSKVPVFMSH